MSPQGLNPGDRVVDLSALAQSAASIAGAVSAALLTWMIQRSSLASSVAFVAGGASGYVVGRAVARIVYRGATGRSTTVVKVGPAALPKTARAGSFAGIAAALLVAPSVLLIFHAHPAPPLFFILLGCSAGLGALWGCLASLL